MISPTVKILAGFPYLANKFFFSRSERSKTEEKARLWKIWSWIAYLIGLPAWVYILWNGSDVIAALVEVAGAPSLVTGLYLALRRKKSDPPKWLYFVALSITVFGVILSFWMLKGLSSFTQILEMGLAVGFLVGTFLLGVKKNFKGYLWLLLMNICCAILMGYRGHWILLVQQILSVFFVYDAYKIRKRRI